MKRSRKILIIVLLSISALILAVTIGVLFSITKDAVLDKNKLPDDRSKLVFLDDSGKIIPQEDYASIQEIPEHVKNAFIAVEDKRFYQHHGIDARRLLGATFQNIKSRSLSQGGSTITCQLVKNTHLTNEKTIERKLKEAKIALEVEKIYSKDQILEFYLNVIYFGKGVYGIKDASKTYFNKNPKELTVKEGASLAAVIANPARYTPINREENERRTDMVLRLMKNQGYLSQEEYHNATTSNIVISYNDFHNNYTHIYTKMALFEIKRLGPALSKDKQLHVYTYLNTKTEVAARKAIDGYTNAYPVSSEIEFIVADNETCGVTTYLSTGSSTPLKRQPASLLKPFIYTIAIEKGSLVPDTPILDQKTDFNGYVPQNYGNIHYGWVDAKFALSHSLNVPAVSLLQQIGINNAVQRIKETGIALNDNDKHLALALGGTTYGSTLPEICKGYLTLANGGVSGDLAFIKRIEDEDGNVLYRHLSNRKVVFNKSSCYLTTEMLKDCAQNGTGKQLSYLSYPIAVKTGTVARENGNSDAWCAAYTTKNTFVCRYSATSTPLPNESTGGNLPTKTIRQVARSIYENEPPKDFVMPYGITKRTIDKGIKSEFHKLVPYQYGSFGDKEVILTTSAFRFEEINAEDLYFGKVDISSTASGVSILLHKAKGLEYAAYLNGKECKEFESGFITPKTAFPLAKLELLCKKEDKILYKKTKILRLPYSFMISSDSNASRIKRS